MQNRDHKMKVLSEIIDMMDDHMLSGLKKKGAPDASVTIEEVKPDGKSMADAMEKPDDMLDDSAKDGKPEPDADDMDEDSIRKLMDLYQQEKEDKSI